MRALSDSSEEVPHGPRRQAYRPDRRPLGTHSPALHFRAIGLPTAFAMPEAWRAICLRKREARPSADAEGAENGERLRRRRRREDDRGLRASGSAWARGRCTTARGGCGARSRTPRPRRAEPRGKAMPARSPPNGRSSTWPSFRRSRTMPASRGSSRRSSGRTPSTRRGSSSPTSCS